MSAPAETVLVDEKERRRIGDLLITCLKTQTCPA